MDKEEKKEEKQRWMRNNYIVKFTPSPTAIVQFVGNDGKAIKTTTMNRKERRRQGIKK